MVDGEAIVTAVDGATAAAPVLKVYRLVAVPSFVTPVQVMVVVVGAEHFGSDIWSATC